jgi:hypothetical protein
MYTELPFCRLCATLSVFRRNRQLICSPSAIIKYCTTDQLSFAPSPIRRVTYRTAQPWLCPATNVISNCSFSHETCLDILLVYFHCAFVDVLFNLPANIDPISYVVVRYLPFFYSFFYLYYITPRNLFLYTCGYLDMRIVSNAVYDCYFKRIRSEYEI